MYVHSLAADKAAAAAGATYLYWYLPGLALQFALVAMGSARVRETFRSAAWMSSAVMGALTVLCLWTAPSLVRLFTSDAAVVAVGATYLQIVSWNFVAAGLAFTASSMFQAIGNSWPSLISSGTRLVTYVAPALWLDSHGNFELTLLWWMSVAGVTLQAIVAMILIAQQFRQRLVPRPQQVATT